MRRIGFWIENIDDERHIPPQECVGELSSDVIERVSEYLDAGHVFQTYRSSRRCLFDCGAENVQRGGQDLTDGSWVWPSELSHYLSRHNVALPEEFIADALRNRKTEYVHNSHEEVDEECWINWCKSRVSKSYLSRISAARSVAAERQAVLTSAYLKEIEVKAGLSQVTCITKGCGNFALRDVVFCAACWLRLGGYDPGIDAKIVVFVEFLENYRELK